MRSINQLAVGLICLISMFHVSASAGDRYNVINVEPSDFLNLRDVQSGIDKATDARVVGMIPHDATDLRATGRTLEVDGSTWRELTFEGATGWVNGRFLTFDYGSSEWDQGEKLSCRGTEPFWNYQIAGNKVVLEHPYSQGRRLPNLSVKVRRSGLGRPGLWFVYAESEDKLQSLSAVINRSGQCENASDYLFDLEIFLMGVIPGKGPVYGCCIIEPK